jgi:hypothetical protein
MVRNMDETKGCEGIFALEVTSGKKKPGWFQKTLKESKEYVGDPKNFMRERKSPKSFSTYLAMVTGITDYEPTAFEETKNHQVWKDSMQEEYDSIM